MMHFYDRDRPPASKCNGIIPTSAQLRRANRLDHAYFYSQQSKNETPAQKYSKHAVESVGQLPCHPHYNGGIDALLRS